MSVIPCEHKIGCESDYPLTNYSAEDPDPRTFLGYSTGTAPTSSFRRGGGSGPQDGGPDRDDTGDGYDGTGQTGTGGNPPPLGSTWDNPVITTFGESTESQAQAHDNAGNNNVSGMTTSSDSGGAAGGVRLSNGLRPAVFGNDPQMCSVTCPDGQTFTFTVAANKFLQLSKAKANAAALSYACKQAQLNQVCLGPVNPTATVGEFYDSTIIAFAANVPITFTVISGDIPTWADATVDTNDGRVRIFGTPGTGDVGDTNFTIQAVDAFGNTMTRAYTITVSSGAACDPVASPAVSTFLRTIKETVYCNKTNTVFAIDGSTNQSIIELDTNGTILNSILIGFTIGCIFYENTNQRIYIGYQVSPGVVRVASYNPSTRILISTAILTVVSGTPSNAERMAYDTTRNKLWVHDGNNFVWSLNATTFAQSVVELGSGAGDFNGPTGMVYCENQDKITMLGAKLGIPNTVSIASWNPATMAYSFIDTGSTDNGSGDMCYNPNNGLAYGVANSNALVIDPDNTAGFSTIALAGAIIPLGAGYNPCTDRVVALSTIAGSVVKAYYIDPGTDTVVGTVSPGSLFTPDSCPITYDATNARLWAGTGSMLLKFT